jgi:hypothetical protein
MGGRPTSRLGGIGDVGTVRDALVADCCPGVGIGQMDTDALWLGAVFLELHVTMRIHERVPDTALSRLPLFECRGEPRMELLPYLFRYRGLLFFTLSRAATHRLQA